MAETFVRKIHCSTNTHLENIGKIFHSFTLLFCFCLMWISKKILKLNLQSYSSSHHLPRWKGRPYWWRKSSASWPTRRSCKLQVATPGWTAPWSGCWWRHLCRKRRRSSSSVGVCVKAAVEKIISVEYLGPSQNSRWKQTRTPCSGKEPQDWHSGRTTGREIAVYAHNINLVGSHVNGCDFAWSFAFCFYNCSVCLPEKWGWGWIKCSRCSSVCSRQRWALSFPDFLWGNPVRHTQ